ncbi:MAG: ACR3 family arsenite efflux transporter [bacterium]|nr:ACR3 family arsenite efflux transporter [bacterium]
MREAAKAEHGREQGLGFFQKYLTVWVGACILAGIALGRAFPGAAEYLKSIQLAQVNLPVAVLLFGMMYPIMVRIDFSEVTNAIRAPRPVLLTLVVNWGIKPFTMFLLATLFLQRLWTPFIDAEAAREYVAGMILLGIAPCTAMVLVWSYLARASMGLTLVMVAINSLTMLVLYAPLGNFLLGVARMPIPFLTILWSVLLYVGVSLVAGYFSRVGLLRARGRDWYEGVFLKRTEGVSILALLATLIFLFTLQGDVIIRAPGVVALIAVPLFLQTVLIFLLTYLAAWLLGFAYRDAAPAGMIGASNHFEVAIATAVTLFGLESGAALATVVGVLIEVPVMLMLVRVCLATAGRFGPARDSASLRE